MFVIRTIKAQDDGEMQRIKAGQSPTAAEHQIVAAVFRPLMLAPALKMTPVPRNSADLS